MKLQKRVCLTVFCLCVVLSAFLVVVRGFWEVGHPELVLETISSESLPASFDGLRILHLTDLHGRFLEDESFLATLRKEAPDLIAITGDLLSRDSTEEMILLVEPFVKRLCEIAPVYYVGGNHEAKQPLWESVTSAVCAGGGRVLSDQVVTLERGGEAISLVGLCDPFCRSDPREVQLSYEEQTNRAIKRLGEEAEAFSLLLAHRPEDVLSYASAGMDVALCGHTHGGQIRLPFIGAIFAPSQGFFPEYSSGLYQVEGTSMYISRGLGGDFRFLCRPEIALLELRTG